MNDETYVIYLIAKYNLVTFAALWVAVFGGGFLCGIGVMIMLLAHDRHLGEAERLAVHEYLGITEAAMDANPFLGITPPVKPDWYIDPGPMYKQPENKPGFWFKVTGDYRLARVLKWRKQFVSRETFTVPDIDRDMVQAPLGTRTISGGLTEA